MIITIIKNRIKCQHVMDPRSIQQRNTVKDHADPGSCQRLAYYDVDGVVYCKLHTGQLAIREVMK